MSQEPKKPAESKFSPWRINQFLRDRLNQLSGLMSMSVHYVQNYFHIFSTPASPSSLPLSSEKDRKGAASKISELELFTQSALASEFLTLHQRLIDDLKKTGIVWKRFHNLIKAKELDKAQLSEQELATCLAQNNELMKKLYSMELPLDLRQTIDALKLKIEKLKGLSYASRGAMATTLPVDPRKATEYWLLARQHFTSVINIDKEIKEPSTKEAAKNIVAKAGMMMAQMDFLLGIASYNSGNRSADDKKKLEHYQNAKIFLEQMLQLIEDKGGDYPEYNKNIALYYLAQINCSIASCHQWAAYKSISSDSFQQKNIGLLKKSWEASAEADRILQMASAGNDAFREEINCRMTLTTSLSQLPLHHYHIFESITKKDWLKTVLSYDQFLQYSPSSGQLKVFKLKVGNFKQSGTILEDINAIEELLPLFDQWKKAIEKELNTKMPALLLYCMHGQIKGVKQLCRKNAPELPILEQGLLIAQHRQRKEIVDYFISTYADNLRKSKNPDILALLTTARVKDVKERKEPGDYPHAILKNASGTAKMESITLPQSQTSAFDDLPALIAYFEQAELHSGERQKPTKIDSDLLKALEKEGQYIKRAKSILADEQNKNKVKSLRRIKRILPQVIEEVEKLLAIRLDEEMQTRTTALAQEEQAREKESFVPEKESSSGSSASSPSSAHSSSTTVKEEKKKTLKLKEEKNKESRMLHHKNDDLRLDIMSFLPFSGYLSQRPHPHVLGDFLDVGHRNMLMNKKVELLESYQKEIKKPDKIKSIEVHNLQLFQIYAVVFEMMGFMEVLKKLPAVKADEMAFTEMRNGLAHARWLLLKATEKPEAIAKLYETVMAANVLLISCHQQQKYTQLHDDPFFRAMQAEGRKLGMADEGIERRDKEKYTELAKQLLQDFSGYGSLLDLPVMSKSATSMANSLGVIYGDRHSGFFSPEQARINRHPMPIYKSPQNHKKETASNSSSSSSSQGFFASQTASSSTSTQRRAKDSKTQHRHANPASTATTNPGLGSSS